MSEETPVITVDDAINHLAVYTAMEDCQLALNCERIVRAEIVRLNDEVRGLKDAIDDQHREYARVIAGLGRKLKVDE